MIQSAEEFVALRTSRQHADYQRAARDAAETGVWLDVIERFPRMRVWVAHNKTVPLDVLERLAHDPDVDVRCAVAMRRALSAAIFNQLVTDEDDSVRARIAYNRKAPRAVLLRLASDPVGHVRDAAVAALAHYGK